MTAKIILIVVTTILFGLAVYVQYRYLDFALKARAQRLYFVKGILLINMGLLATLYLMVSYFIWKGGL